MKFFRKIADFFIPPKEWRIPVYSLLVVLAVVLIQIFFVSRAYSYLSDDPTACINCHVMIPEYTSWSRSVHQSVATCNDCHVPQDNIFKKYAFKAMDGIKHSSVFTAKSDFGAIEASSMAKNVIQSNCLRCHESVVRSVSAKMVKNHSDGKSCFECHVDVAHGDMRGFFKVPVNPLDKRSGQFLEIK